MHRVFNNGIGLVVIVSAEDAEKARGAFEAQGEKGLHDRHGRQTSRR